MRSLIDHAHVLDAGLAAIREQYSLPGVFPEHVLAAAEVAVRREPTEHVDRTDWPFVTLDPASATDLDQAFSITRSGGDLLLHYAIADVGWFVQPGDVLDSEAWKRGTTMYLPDGRTSLYPPVLSEGAASLLPDGPRPAVVFHVRVASDGEATLDGAERSLILSRAKLAYDTVTPADLPADFDELGRRVQAAELARGAGKVDPPEQVVERTEHGYTLLFRPRLASESRNAAMSLAANLAVAQVMLQSSTGLFRVMASPDERAVRRLRHTAKAFGLQWPAEVTLDQYVRTLDGTKPADGAFMLAVRRAGGGADYVPFEAGVIPWHAAMAATYAHVTAPLRRLADRYVVEATLALANGVPVPSTIAAAFEPVAAVMNKADTVGSRLDREVIELAEAIVLQDRVGHTFDAVVIDDDPDSTTVAIAEVAVIAKVQARGVRPGDEVRVKVAGVDLDRRTVELLRVS